MWSYAKASKEKVDRVAAIFYADPQKMELLSILDEQVELLAKEGRPDLLQFLDSLESRSITPSTEVLSLRAEYGLEREPLPQDCLAVAIESVVEGIGHVPMWSMLASRPLLKTGLGLLCVGPSWDEDGHFRFMGGGSSLSSSESVLLGSSPLRLSNNTS